jgi:hypothetical protein
MIRWTGFIEFENKTEDIEAQACFRRALAIEPQEAGYALQKFEGPMIAISALAGVICIAAALMVLFIGTGRRGVAEPDTAKAYS